MTENVITVHVNECISKVQSLLDDNPIHHIVVLDGGVVRGIINKNDILRAYQKKNWSGEEFVAGDVMTKDPIVVDPDDTIGLVSDIILSNRFHSLPVVEDVVLVGIVTSHDLIKYCF